MWPRRSAIADAWGSGSSPGDHWGDSGWAAAGGDDAGGADEAVCGGVAGAGAIARRVAVRHDHGNSFMSNRLQNQIKFWGMSPSFVFVRDSETNGVAERFFRTFKEQVLHSRIYQTIDDIRAAVREFFKRDNAEWLIDKSGLLRLRQTRIAWENASMNRLLNPHSCPKNRVRHSGLLDDRRVAHG